MCFAQVVIGRNKFDINFLFWIALKIEFSYSELYHIQGDSVYVWTTGNITLGVVLRPVHCVYMLFDVLGHRIPIAVNFTRRWKKRMQIF